MKPTVYGIAVVKNEDDIIQHTLNHLLTQEIDHFIIADNMSSDNTGLILDSFDQRFDGKFSILEDREPGHYHSKKMNWLMELAIERGAEIILPFDADEIWLAHDKSKTVGEILRSNVAEVFVAEVVDMLGAPKTGNVLVDLVWREPAIKSLPSVAFKWQQGCHITEGNHDVIHSGSRDFSSLYIRHYQYRSLNQFKRKVRNGKAAYDITDLPEAYGSHWRTKGSMSDEELLMEWNNYLNQSGLIYDPIYPEG